MGRASHQPGGHLSHVAQQHCFEYNRAVMENLLLAERVKGF
jgi:hypothetical protein